MSLFGNNTKNIYHFGPDQLDGDGSLKNILGGKGANLSEMVSLGIPVPPGFVISTQVCRDFYKNDQSLEKDFFKQVKKAVSLVEKTLDRKLGDNKKPLLLSVRSGSVFSMPGMMDTILNLGLNDQTVEALAQFSGNERFAWDSYRRFLQMYSNVVLGMNSSILETFLEDLKQDKKYEKDSDMSVDDLKTLTVKFKEEIFRSTSQHFPEDPFTQLEEAIKAVFKSWNNSRAVTYRKLNDISHDLGTAVTIQSMVFGNLNESSATGVAFTRNPSTGEKVFFGEYLIKAQGEDVVAVIRTPYAITKQASGDDSLEVKMPKAYSQLVDIYKKLEKHYKDMQDIEFTIEDNKLWILQTRKGKRAAKAALKIALDMLDEKLITESMALNQISPESLNQLLHPSLDTSSKRENFSKGLPASPGAVSGEIVFDSESVLEWKQKGIPCILVRIETSPEDIEGMIHSEGILTSRGGMTSHAAVVARGMGKSCIVGAASLEINYQDQSVKAGSKLLKKGDKITLDGSTGEVFLGEIKKIPPLMDENFKRIISLCSKYQKVQVRANADNKKDALVASNFEASGIGLCRTEHMFFGKKRILLMRQMILADNYEKRMEFLNELKKFQVSDFKELFETLKQKPVTIRLLDPPLHEFLPRSEGEIAELCEASQFSKDYLMKRLESLKEFNPMLGHRGCRLAISFPEIYIMQLQGICEAIYEVFQNTKQKSQVEIMLPLINHPKEFSFLKKKLVKEIEKLSQKFDFKFDFLIGTMIELPRACLVADEIATEADFFSFGTNDLTQTALGLSRDDSAHFLDLYVDSQIYEADPFVVLDQRGVGKLVKIAIDLGKKTKSKLKLGLCGEHGGNPKSAEFFQEIGLDYVSCSPYRVPIAKLALAQVVTKES